MSTSITSGINLSSLGIGDGMDDSSIISQLVAIEATPQTQLETKASTITSASSTLTTFISDVSTLQQAANTLATPSNFNVYSATSSQSQVVATTAAGASAGAYSVTVSQVAQVQSTMSSAQGTSNSAALGLSGTFGIAVGSKTYDVSVASTDSLADIATSINESGAPVNAAVVFDGTNYYLEMQGSQTGAANAFTFSETDGGNALSTLDLTTASDEQAQNTEAVVNGMSVSSSTTQISGAIPGVTLAVTGQTDGAATVDVTTSASTLESQLQSFVTAYNAVVNTGHSDIGYGSTAASNTLLANDPGIRSALDQLPGIIASTVAGADSTYTTLGSIGLNLGSDGTLSLDTGALTTAVQNDPSGVEKLLADQASSGSQGAMNTISKTIDQLCGTNSAYVATGTNSTKTAFLPGEVSAFNSENTKISTQETALQARLQAYQTMLETEFTQTDETVNNERTLFSAVGGSGTFM